MTTTNPASLERLGAEIINTYLFDKVWNEPVSEYRSNIQPAKCGNRSVVGLFATMEGRIPLPTDREAYYLWTIGSDELGFIINIPSATWVDIVDCCNNYRVKFDFYDVQGHMFPKSGVYIRYNYDRRVLFFAVKKEIITKCSDITLFNRNDVYITTYYDSDTVNKINIVSFKVGADNSENQLAVDKLMASARKDSLIIYKNGVEITQGGSPSLTHGDWFEFVVDENIIFAFDVDLVTQHESPAYLSTADQMWKQLIHIPKALNPDNNIYTHNTCDFFIRRAQGTMPYGLYMHRIAKTSVTQVTHNDFSVPLIVIDAYRDYLHEQEISMHVIVRQHEKDNVLIPDANYIYLLYADKHDDQRIIDILCGLGPSNIPWWKASELEQSAFIKMLFDTPEKSIIDSELMNNYIDALGYYHVVNLLCPRILDTALDSSTDHNLILSKPMMYSGFDIVPLLYLNGRHLPFNRYQYANSEGNSIFIALDTNLVIKKGDVLTTVCCLSSNNKCCMFTLDTDTLVIELPYHDPVIYEQRDTTNRENVVGICNTYTKSFVERGSGNNIFGYRNNDDGTCTVTFNNQYIGSVYAIQNRYATYRLSYDITNLVRQGKTLAVELVQQDSETLEFAPIINLENTSVYYNNHYLVRGIDYEILQLRDSDGNVCATELVIQTMDHYTEDTNVIDVLVNQDAIRDNSNGFVVTDKLYDDSPVNLMFRDITLTHVNGVVERNVANKGNYMIIPSGVYKTGDIWEIQTCIPRLIIDFIAKYSDKNDNDRLTILNAYFSTLPDEDPDTIVIDEKHRLYSSFLNEVIRLTLEGSISVSIDPDKDRLDEALRVFNNIKEADVVYDDLDQRFVDFYPQYVNQAVSPEYKTIVEYLVNTYLPKNEYPSLHSMAEECD